MKVTFWKRAQIWTSKYHLYKAHLSHRTVPYKVVWLPISEYGHVACTATETGDWSLLWPMISPRAVHDISTPKFIKLSRRKICIFTKTNTGIYFVSYSGDDKYFFRNSEIRFLRTAHQTVIGITLLTQRLYYKTLKVSLGNAEVPDLSEASKFCTLCSGVEWILLVANLVPKQKWSSQKLSLRE